jgi:hypothetical protein
MRGRRKALWLEPLEERALLATTVIPGTVSGMGTVLQKQDTFNVNVTASVTGGTPSYSGSLSFSDSKAGDTFNTASITSVLIGQPAVPGAPSGSAAGTYNAFTIMGTAKLNGGSSTYGFTATGLLPGAGAINSTGGLAFSVTGPNGFSYSLPTTAWDPGESIVITVTTPTLIPTTTHLTSSVNPSVYGQPVYFTAAVSANPSSATGTTASTVTGYVGFSVDGGTAVDEPLVGGQAVYRTTSLSVASHSIVATYLGTTVFATSHDTIAAQVVNQDKTTTYLSYSGSFTIGQPLTLAATVGAQTPGSGTPTGTVTFMDGTTPLDSTPIPLTSASTASAPTAKLSLPTGLPVGSHSITAVYSGDTNFLTSTSSPPLVRTVEQFGTATTLKSSANPATINQSVTLTATIALPTSISTTLLPVPTGTVDFTDGTTDLGKVPLNGSTTVTLPVSFTTGGYHALKAVYNGDSNYNGSSATLTEAVSTPTALTLTPPANPSVYGQRVTFTAAVTPNPGPTPRPVTTNSTVAGYVSFTIDSNTPVTEPIVNGQAAYSTTGLSVGSHTIVAKFAGTSLFAGSQGTIAAQVVNQDKSTTYLTYSGSFTIGQPLTLTAYVGAQSPGAGKPTGTVTFMDGTTALDSTPIPLTSATTSMASTATLSLSTGLPAGSHSITAVYSGDTNFLMSTSSPPLVKTVALVSTTTTLTSSVNPVVTGNAVTLTATVSLPSTGTSTSSPNKLSIPTTESVTFYDVTGGTSTKLGTVPISSAGVAQLPSSFTTAGSHSLTAVYSGDSTFSSSTGTLAESVSSTKATGHVYLAASANPALAGQSVTFSVYVYGATSESTGVTGTVTLMDGTTPLGSSSPVTNDKASFTISSLGIGSHAITASYSGDANFTAATSSVLTETISPTGTISGTATLLNKQDTFNVDVKSSVSSSGTPSYSGALSFSDTLAGDTFTAATITGVQIYTETPAGGSATGAYSYFRITGTATLNGGTSPAYSFIIAASLPTSGATNASGYFTITVTGPGGFSYTAQSKALDPGSTIVITT